MFSLSVIFPLVALIRKPFATWEHWPLRMLTDFSAIHFSTASSPLSKKHQAAFQRYSRTWIKSITRVALTFNRIITFFMSLIWWGKPSIKITHSLFCLGSLCNASSKASSITVSASRSTLAQTRLFLIGALKGTTLSSSDIFIIDSAVRIWGCTV